MEAGFPRSAQKSNLSDKEWVLETITRILDKWRPEKFNLVKHLLIDAEMITTTDILEGVTKLIFEKAVLEPNLSPMYAELCSDLIEDISPFPSEELNGKAITFKRLLLNYCQEAFECTESLMEEIRKMTGPDQELECSERERMLKVRYVGNICLIGELFKRDIVPEKIVHHVIKQLLGHDNGNTCLEEENVEAICRLFYSIGKQLDRRHFSNAYIDQLKGQFSDAYFDRLKELAMKPHIKPRWRFMLSSILALRAKKWIPGLKESMSSLHSGGSPCSETFKCESCGVRSFKQPNDKRLRCSGCAALKDGRDMPFNLFRLEDDAHHTTVQLKYQMLDFQASVERQISELEGKIIFYLRLLVGLIVWYMIGKAFK